MTCDWKDFNDAKTQLLCGESMLLSAQEIKSILVRKLHQVLAHLLPRGVIKNGKFYVGDIHGNKGDSLVVELSGPKAGQWHDFATHEGGDILSLWASVHGKDTYSQFPDVMRAIQDWLGSPYHRIVLKSVEDLDQDLDQVSGQDLGKVTGKWDYQDADGNLIACVYRYDPPTGKQFRPWDVKMRCHRAPEIRPLYNQPGIITARVVVLVEGEKAAQALIDAGVCATTAMNGAHAPMDGHR